MNRTIDIFSSVLASSVRSWRGTTASKITEQPEKDLILYDREGCPKCRFVREALCELNLDVTIAPCPIGGRNLASLKKESESDQVPRLIDQNTGANIAGTQAIVEYLFEEYRGKPVPPQLKGTKVNKIASNIASQIRMSAGIRAIPSEPAELPLTLYSFESSPYSRPVRELLCELEVPYKLVNLGKQQRADMGPANFRFSLKPYQPLPNTKRDAFFKKHGNVQVPFLVDPNTGTEMFESAEILKYLKETYQK